MSAERKQRRQADLADPSAALASYLDDLLHTATSTALEEVPDARPEADPSPPVTRPDEAVVPDIPPATPDPGPRVAAPVAPVPVAEPVVHEQTQAPVEPEPEALPEGRPDWAERPFECLIFRVAGLQLAVPLVLLGAIHRIEDRIKPIPGRPPWYMGMLPDRGVNLKVVDSARWIMPDRAPADARDGYRFVIRLDDSDWSLACDEVAESFTLDPDQVRWRTSRSKRPWLAGTVVQHMCALIDVGAMARMLARAEKEQRLDLE
ncbi:CheW domain-containing protein [Marinobacter sp.]|uniref:CheW domain-containing protein n=1 Tax=Marinobacter sp. TaxID=50741 RepID=UPI003562F995